MAGHGESAGAATECFVAKAEGRSQTSDTAQTGDCVGSDVDARRGSWMGGRGRRGFDWGECYAVKCRRCGGSARRNAGCARSFCRDRQYNSGIGLAVHRRGVAAGVPKNK